MTYTEVIKYLESFINYEKIPAYPYKESLKLERIKEFLATINNPQDALKCIHIAGTKGKGSTCAFVTYILREAGYKVGLYTSPHLSDFRERIRILQSQVTSRKSPACPAGRQVTEDFEGMISEDGLIDLVERLKLAIEKYNKNSKYGPLSFFEVYTSLAFAYFKEKKLDFTVLETGLGGRLDATNVVNPYVCAITPISYEHTQKLGNTLREIATEKAGIIKRKCQVSSVKCQGIIISAPQEKEAGEVIRNRCREMGVKLYEVGNDIIYEKNNDTFSVKGIFGEYPDLNIRLLGGHQLINATVAVGIIEALRSHNISPVRNTKATISENKIANGVNVGIDSIRNGLYNTVWPGRCDVISRDPLIVLDGAQNIASVRALKETIRENFEYKRLILILGISQDKDIRGICNELSDFSEEVILTKANNPRATSPDTLAKYFNGKPLYITDNIKEAKFKVKDIAKREDLILVTGSLFVVGEFREDAKQYQ